MKQKIYAPNTVPTANIAVNKSRLKVYENAGSIPTYYLQKGQEFQIELFNPTTDVVLAKISLNGKAISQGGLVLNPGQRVYLDRYLDVAKKFLFDTYEVGKSEEVKAAIKDNGDFKVEFFKESKPVFVPDYTYRPLLQWKDNGFNKLGGYGSGTPTDFLRGSSTGGYSGEVNCGHTTYSSPSTSAGITLNGLNGTITNCVSSNAIQGNSSFTNSGDGMATMDWMQAEKSLNDEATPSPLKKRLRTASLKSSKTIETGRVEMGSESDQKLKVIDKSFEFFAFHTTTYKMLPLSQKINTAEDINVKRYCTHCGAKVGKTDNFCGKCGKKA